MRMTPLFVAVTLAVCSSPALAGPCTYDYDRTADFSKYHTYAWAPGTPVPDELAHRRVVAAFDAELAGKGLRLAGPGETPDLRVAYHAGFGRDLQVVGSGRRLGGLGTARVERTLTGALAIEIADAGTGSPLWHGVASRDVRLDASPESRDREVAKLAKKLLAKYPVLPEAVGKSKKH